MGNERLIAGLTGGFQAAREELTPLERIVDRLLRILLVVVTILILLLLADYFDLALPLLHVDAVSSAASVIFGLAPASLFLMILVNYAMSTADLARLQALVYRSRSVESLAQATALCLTQAAILTGVGPEMEPIIPLRAGDTSQRPPLAESRIRQILGDYAHSTSAENPVVRAMRGAFPGSPRRFREEAPFLSAHGWSAISFEDADLRGTYVLGDPGLLETHLVRVGEEPGAAEEEESGLETWRRRVAGLGSFWRSEDSPQGDQLAEPSETLKPHANQASHKLSGADLFRRLSERSGVVLRRKESGPAEEVGKHGELVEDQQVEELVYLAAYHPEVVALQGADDMPRLPAELIPLCQLRYTEQIRPEAVETVEAFSRMGVSFKVFSPDAPEQTTMALSRAGLGKASQTPLRAISGTNLSNLDHGQLSRAVTRHNIFGHVTPDQEGLVVESLHEQGEVVTVVGDGVNDLPAMRQAQLSIARHSSSPAALSEADIVLLENSPKVLLRVLEKGQRVANGLLDILKLYLTNLSYLTLLILAIWGTGTGFPHQSKQGSLVAIVTLVLPSLGLSLWAIPGVLSRADLGRLLARTVVPAGVGISVAAVRVYWVFLSRTSEVAYAQLALTYVLLISGLVLVMLIRPPLRVGTGSDERSGDWRPTVLVLVLLVLVFAFASIPLAEDLFGLSPLRQPVDYSIAGLAVLAWVATVSLIWWAMSLTGRSR